MTPGGARARRDATAATVGGVITGPGDATSASGVAIVTGGARGIGRDAARTFAARGYAVVVVYHRDQREAETAVEEILAANGTALAVRADVADKLDVERLFDETVAAFGDVSVVVHTGPDTITPELDRELRLRDITVVPAGDLE